MKIIEILQLIISLPLIFLILLQNKSGGIWGERGPSVITAQRELKIATAFLVLIFIVLGVLNLLK